MDIMQVIIIAIGGLIGILLSLIAYIFQSLKNAQNATFKKIDKLGEKLGEWQKEISDDYLKKEDAKDMYQKKK